MLRKVEQSEIKTKGGESVQSSEETQGQSANE